MLQLAIFIVLVWVLGPLVVVLCAMGLLAALAVLAAGGVTVGLVWGATALFGPAVGVPVGLACVAFLCVGGCFLYWRGDRGYGEDKGVGVWLRWVARETPTPEFAVLVVTSLALIVSAQWLWHAYGYRPGPLLVVLGGSLVAVGVGVSFFVRTELLYRGGRTVSTPLPEAEHGSQRSAPCCLG